MTENDYIAEYVKEKRPEIIGTVDFITWKLGRLLADSMNELCRGLKNACKNLSSDDIKKIIEEGNDEEEKEIL